jgi:hypothetical protein
MQDRLARSIRLLIQIADQIKGRKARLRIPGMSFGAETATGTMMRHVLEQLPSTSGHSC